MKKLLMLIAIVAMVLVVAPAAFAGNGNGNGTGTGTGGGTGGGTGTCDGTGTGGGTGTCDGTGTGTGTSNNAGAGNGAASKRTIVNYSLSGKVTAVDAEAGAITVTVVKGNKAARPYKGQTITLNVTATTLLRERTVDGDLVVVTLADFAVGDRVNSAGRLNRADATAPVFTAKRVTIALPLGTCLVP